MADTDSAPAVGLLADTQREAAARGASDSHVEPGEHEWRIRLRIDGALHTYLKPPPHLRDAFTTRIKVLAHMDIAQRRVPQDGRLRLPLANGNPEDHRVNSLPVQIRDAETADVVVKAAQTGHLVLFTLHTNDAPAAIARLIDIGIAPYNLASALRLVTAQRLVRRLCEACRMLSEPEFEPGFRPFEARGCASRWWAVSSSRCIFRSFSSAMWCRWCRIAAEFNPGQPCSL
ncbi:Flp pilus assembly complex ATPase component TadA [Caballeronia sp. SEWSISQ10-4 2]|uniref:GspE/PulE family protein n=1 Tax=Caballeronia sp. SEWSISQ10-4 2 TaxID=2937438 RepID=UPI0026501FF7|nr:ATPase, T2SS/T4P/T4SS family [Caballeronia sp. SEWSISQ10-4 2]MDN7182136.1 Flp pilus assembly complex ATPase component TadA [Caballeronia sp. SEWSISQ10-4 2]